MSDIFISYKREEQDKARQLADALEKQGWSVWWDPKLRAGEHFDDVIQKALQEARCVIVLWSKRSVQSRYVKDESSYALRRGKLVPVTIEDVELPFRFEVIHTLSLADWGGSDQFPAFKNLIDDIVTILNKSAETEPKRMSSIISSGKMRPDHVTDGLESKRSEQTPVFQDILNDGSREPQMVRITSGKFRMGDISGDGEEDERLVRPVQFLRPFAISKYEVTFDEYDQYVNAKNLELPDDSGFGRGQRPVINVSWYEAIAYTEWLKEQTGKRYRLPTEAEWEYVARAGSETRYWWGDAIDQDGKVWANSEGCGSQWDNKETAPVGQFPANAFGLYDTAGNVWEWVQDCWHENYKGAPKDGRIAWEEEGGGDCGRRVIRGGSWNGEPGDLRSAFRYRGYAVVRGYFIGFRLAQDLE